MSAAWRPNVVKIERRTSSVASPTGSDAPAAPTVLNAAVPALLERDFKGNVSLLVDGTVFVRDAFLLVDGLRPYQFVGTPPGGTIVAGGVTYTVDANGLAAFPDCLEGDRITDERGLRYLVLATSLYALTCTLQVELASGRAWA